MRVYSEFTTGLASDLEYRVFNGFGYPLSAWLDSDIEEDLETPGLYFTDLYGLHPTSTVVRWRQKTNHTNKQVVPLHKMPLNPNKEGVHQLSDDSFSYYLDTRNYRNGAAVLRVYAKGSDGLWAKASRDFYIDNDLASNTYYKEFPYVNQVGNSNIIQAVFGLDSFGLSSNPQRRGWLQTGYRITGSALPNNPTTQNGETWWSELTVLPVKRTLSWKRDGNKLVPSNNVSDNVLSQLTCELSVETTEDTSENPITSLWAGIKISPWEYLSAYSLNAEKALYIERLDEDDYRIYTYNPAQVLKYRSSSGLTLARNFSSFEADLEVNYNWPGKIVNLTRVGSDAAYLAITQYYDDTNEVYNRRLFLIYHDESKKPFELIPWGETQSNIFDVATNKEGKGVAFYFDTPSLTMTAYDAFSLEVMWTHVFEDTPIIKRVPKIGKLAFFDGNKLLISEDGGSAEPVVEPFSAQFDEFPDAPVAVGKQQIALQNGEIYYKNAVTGFYSIVLASELGPNIASITEALVGSSIPRVFVSATNSKYLVESSLDGAWSERSVTNAAVGEDDYTALSELYHYQEELDPGSGGVPDDPAFVPPVYDDRLLIATVDDLTGNAPFFVLEKSALSELDGAALVSKISYPTIQATKLSG